MKLKIAAGTNVTVAVTENAGFIKTGTAAAGGYNIPASGFIDYTPETPQPVTATIYSFTAVHDMEVVANPSQGFLVDSDGNVYSNSTFE